MGADDGIIWVIPISIYQILTAAAGTLQVTAFGVFSGDRRRHVRRRRLRRSERAVMRNTIPIMDLNNPDELIRANGAAEAARTNRLREEVSDYTQVIEQLRDLYDRNNELVQKLSS